MAATRLVSGAGARGFSTPLRLFSTSAAGSASAELVQLVDAAYHRRKPFVASDSGADVAKARLDEAVAALNAARDVPGAVGADLQTARADATTAAYELSRIGPDLEDMPIRRLHDVSAYKHLGDSALSGFSASELFHGVLAIAHSGEEASDLLSAIAKEATSRVDEFPVHALGSIASVFLEGGALSKGFLRAAALSASKRAHLAKVEDSFSILKSAANAGIGCPELSQEAGTTLAATHESALGGSIMLRPQLADWVALVISTASPDFVGVFAPWAARLVRDEASLFDEESLERITAALERSGYEADHATRKAVARARAHWAKAAEAASMNGFTPEDYGIVSSVARH